MTRSINKLRGFTIVELLIVIVVIAILASISIVSYNGIQNRAKTTAASTVAKSVATKAEMAYTLTGSYPSVATTIAGFNNNTESKITGSGLVLGTPNADNGTSTVQYQACTSGAAAGGARIGTWNYTTGTMPYIYTYVGPASGGAACGGWDAGLSGS